jgi:hypothetical protein
MAPMRIMLIIAFLYIIPFQLSAQIFPKENAMLNYRIIGFSFPARNKHHYKLEIAAGHYNSVDSFTNNIINTVKSDTVRVIAEVPAFGSEYTWRVTGDKQNIVFHHFSTLMNERVDTSKLRLRVIQPAKQFNNYYVSVDGGGVIYDITGRPVWYMPVNKGYGDNVLDMRFTRDGTITFISKDAYEINYEGDILWKSPAKGIVGGDSTHNELFHHEFTKLSNGHFIALGTEQLWCKAVSTPDSSYIIISKDNANLEKNGYKLGRFGTLIEYDEKGKIVWYWKSSNYLLHADFAFFDPIDTNARFDPHENAFLYDEKNECIYLGFRNLNRIVKIQYPGGKVLNTYGKTFKRDGHTIGEGFFCGQHSIGRTVNGYLYCFDNNSCEPAFLPKLIIMKEPLYPSDNLKKIWEYTCISDGKITNFNKGGNAVELADNRFFVNMGSKYSKLFIVNEAKTELWSALPEIYMATDGKWSPNYEYRANIITREDVERLIWMSQY